MHVLSQVSQVTQQALPCTWCHRWASTHNKLYHARAVTGEPGHTTSFTMHVVLQVSQDTRVQINPDSRRVEIGHAISADSGVWRCRAGDQASPPLSLVVTSESAQGSWKRVNRWQGSRKHVNWGQRSWKRVNLGQGVGGVADCESGVI